MVHGGRVNAGGGGRGEWTGAGPRAVLSRTLVVVSKRGLSSGLVD